jgi:hypothetical protein
MLGYSIYKFWKNYDLEKKKKEEIMRQEEERKTFFELSDLAQPIT